MLAWFFSFIAFSLHQPRYSKFPCHELVGQSYIYPGLVYHQLQLDRILKNKKASRYTAGKLQQIVLAEF
jgi:hypothetical protein